MRAALIKIGNSKGIRISKPLVEQCGFGDQVELEVKNRQLVIRSVRRPRRSWGEAFRKMAERGDDLLLETPPSSWNERVWDRK